MEMEFGQFFRKLESNVMVVRRRKQLLPQDGAEMSRSGEKKSVMKTASRSF